MWPSIDRWRCYIALARPDHWVKHIFIIPGIVAALAIAPTLPVNQIFYNIAIGFISACLIASSNYVINEWLDAETDRHHPEKANRPAAAGRITRHFVYLGYAILAVSGLVLAYSINTLFFIASLAFYVSGITYNVRPFRTKDRVYLDVFSEAINNPIRLTLGWAMISSNAIPPLSLVVLYWAGGAFLMAAKRLSEYQYILAEKGPDGPGAYRRSFRYYSFETLLVSCFVYALTATFGIAVFLIKYRAEFVLTFPLIVLLFGYYLYLGLQPISVAQKPEKLHRDGKLILIVLALCTVTAVFAFVDLPGVERITQSSFVELSFD
jgi:decaprenyl-phosphate phosphoribosyltransferase